MKSDWLTSDVQARAAFIASPVISPLVAHCSAGVGRAGSFVATDIQLEMYEATRKIDPYGGKPDTSMDTFSFHSLVHSHSTYLTDTLQSGLSKMRQYRCTVIQTPDQYVFLHQALLDYITTEVFSLLASHFTITFTSECTTAITGRNQS
jgi:protein tyrosine phosphatase